MANQVPRAMDVESHFWQMCDEITRLDRGSFDSRNAELAMLRLVEFVEQHPHERAVFVRCFSEIAMWRRDAAWMLVPFCMRRLRWPEIRELIERDADEHKPDWLRHRSGDPGADRTNAKYFADRMNYWSDINSAYLDDVWRHAAPHNLLAHELPTLVDMASLQRQLAICEAWCGGRFTGAPADGDDISAIFRSVELKKAAARVFPQSCHTAFSDELAAVFREFQAERSRHAPALSGDSMRWSDAGPLLLFEWRNSLFDGAATPLTHGFLDDEYMPSWDTWLELVEIPKTHSKRCLLSWVPPPLMEAVDSAIVCDPAQSLSWCIMADDNRLVLRGWGRGIYSR